VAWHDVRAHAARHHVALPEDAPGNALDLLWDAASPTGTLKPCPGLASARRIQPALVGRISPTTVLPRLRHTETRFEMVEIGYAEGQPAVRIAA
jgi:hypothetical protein